MLAEQEAAGGTLPLWAAGSSSDDKAEAAGPAAPLQVLPGLTMESVHFNSVSSRPARRMAGE